MEYKLSIQIFAILLVVVGLRGNTSGQGPTNGLQWLEYIFHFYDTFNMAFRGKNSLKL